MQHFEVWQSAAITSLRSLGAQPSLRWLNLQELGRLPSMQPLADLRELEVLFITGGIWKEQVISCDLQPLTALTRLRRLAIGGIKGPTDLEPLLNFPHLEHLWVATGNFPVAEVARLAARYAFWRDNRPWLATLQEGHAAPAVAQLKRVWCPSCDAERLSRALTDFDALVRQGGD